MGLDKCLNLIIMLVSKSFTSRGHEAGVGEAGAGADHGSRRKVSSGARCLRRWRPWRGPQVRKRGRVKGVEGYWSYLFNDKAAHGMADQHNRTLPGPLERVNHQPGNRRVHTLGFCRSEGDDRISSGSHVGQNVSESSSSFFHVFIEPPRSPWTSIKSTRG